MATSGQLSGQNRRARDDRVQSRDRRYDVSVEGMVRAYRLPPLPVSLFHVSPGSAMLEADTASLHQGAEVAFGAAGVEVVATISWITGDFFGLAFHRRLESHELIRLRRD